MNRKQRREAERRAKRDGYYDPEFQTALNAFSEVPTECTSCASPFDNTNRAQVDSWYIIVDKSGKKTRLYCPPCWHKAEQIVRK